MTNTSEILKTLIDRRIEVERQIQGEKNIGEREAEGYAREYGRIQRELAKVARDAKEDNDRIAAMLELIRILENKLVYLENFTIEPSSEDRTLAALVRRFIEEITKESSSIITPLESLYYRGIASLYEGDVSRATELFRNACESEESDEANDIKYKSYVILGHLSHEQHDYRNARAMHEESMRYSQHANVTAQALAFRALNSYALGEYDVAFNLFQESLQLFAPDEPFFNSYFYRNALLFCASILFDRKRHEEAETYYRRVIESVEPDSYDYFDALSHLGRICFATGRFDDAAQHLSHAIDAHRFNENEYVVDTYFWLAKTQLKRNDPSEAKKMLEKIVASEVRYEKKPQALELLHKVG